MAICMQASTINVCTIRLDLLIFSFCSSFFSSLWIAIRNWEEKQKSRREENVWICCADTQTYESWKSVMIESAQWCVCIRSNKWWIDRISEFIIYVCLFFAFDELAKTNAGNSISTWFVISFSFDFSLRSFRLLFFFFSFTIIMWPRVYCVCVSVRSMLCQ